MASVTELVAIPPPLARGGVSSHRRRARTGAGARLHVALLAPPWIAVPPPGYGGIEAAVADIATGLVHRGHDVTLLAPPGSHSCAHLVTLLDRSHGDAVGETLYEVDHVGRALEVIDQAAVAGRPFDIVHDHSGFTFFAIADRVGAPVLHTLHGPFTAETCEFYRRHADKAWVSALSHSQLRAGSANLRCAGVVANPIDVEAWPLVRDKRDHLLWIGRMTPEKGPQRAIAIARAAGRPLIIAGPIQAGQREFFDAEVAPHIDDDRVRYVGEVGGQRKQRLFADAAAMLMPIRWPEPFGMVMIEAMACGTPVIAFPEGAAPEIVVDGVSGFLVEDESEMAAAIERLPQIDPLGCRASVANRFDIGVVAGAYERAYRTVIGAEIPPAPTPLRSERHDPGLAAVRPQAL